MRELWARTALAAVVTIAVASAFVGGCAPKTEETGEAPKTQAAEKIKVGVHTSLTGQLADYGFAAQEGLKLAAKDLGTFKIGDKEFEIELVIKDDKGEPAQAAIVAQAFVDEKVAGVIGALTSGNTQAALPIYKKAGIPVISGSATNPGLSDDAFTNFFRTCLRDDLQGAALGEWAASLGFKKAVVFDDKGDYAVGLGNVVQNTLKGKGVTVSRQSAGDKTTDFSAQISNIKSFKPDVVIYTGYHQQAGLLRKQMVEQGLSSIKYMGGDGIKSDEIAGEAGGAKNIEGAMCTFGGLSQEQMPGFAKFASDYKAATGKDSGPYAENNYDALGALVSAMKDSGGTDATKIINALHTIKHAGIMGTFGFNAKGDIEIPGQTGTAAIPHFKMTNGKWVFQEKETPQG